MKSSLLATAVLLGCFLVGCGPSEPDKGPLGTLSGKVTFEGAALTEGTITLARAEGGSGAAELQSDGAFLVTDRAGGIPVGTYKVAFQPKMVEGPANPNSPPQMIAQKILPDKYYSEEKSGLTVEIKEGANTQDFTLTK